MAKNACLCVVIVILFGFSTAAPFLSDTQLEQILADRSIMQLHINCILGEGPCDPVGRKFRSVAPLVLRGVCPSCSPNDVRQIRRTLAYVQRNYPWEWNKMIRHYG